VRGDIATLPFRRGAFVAAMATHVLHLVPRWREVLEQVATLVRPGGTVLLGRDWVDPDSMAGRIRTAFRETVMKLGPRTAAPAGGREVMEALLALGATPLAVGPAEQVAAEWSLRASPRAVLEGIRTKDDAESWVLPDDVLAEVMRSLDAWAAQQWPDLDTAHEVRRRFLIAVFRVGGIVRPGQ
jgi:SAM-dependent methyltransferase